MKRWTSNVAIILSWCVSIGCWFDTTKRYLPSTAYHRLGVRHWIELSSYYYSMLCYGLRIQHYVEPPPLQRMIGWALEIRYSQFPSTVYDGLRFEYQVVIYVSVYHRLGVGRKSRDICLSQCSMIPGFVQSNGTLYSVSHKQSQCFIMGSAWCLTLYRAVYIK